MNKLSPSNLHEANQSISDTITVDNWQVSRTFFLGGAGVSLAVLLVIIQIAGQHPSLSLHAAACCAALAMPLWLALWQMGDTSFLLRKKWMEYAMNLKFILALAATLVCAGLALTASIILLLIHVSWLVAVIFTFMSTISLILTAWHHAIVKSYAEAGGS